MEDNIITYQPDNSLKKGYFHIFKEIYDEIVANKWLTYQLFKREFLSIYKQSFIGVFWAIIIPFISAGTFIILNRAGVFSIGDISVPYPLFAIMGLSLWQLFATGLISSSNALVKAGQMITKINFSKKALVFASSGQAIVSFFIQIVLLLVLFFIYKIPPKIFILLLPLFAVPILLLTLGIGFILSLLNGIFRDIGNVLSVVVTFIMFLTPVLYVKPRIGLLAVLTRFNPMYYLIEMPRKLIFTGEAVHWQGYLISSIFSIVVFIICIIAFHLTETRVAERI